MFHTFDGKDGFHGWTSDALSDGAHRRYFSRLLSHFHQSDFERVLDLSWGESTVCLFVDERLHVGFDHVVVAAPSVFDQSEDPVIFVPVRPLLFFGVFVVEVDAHP